MAPIIPFEPAQNSTAPSMLAAFPSSPKAKSIYFHLAQHRLELYYLFGLVCLASWFAFNLWILRDYFFPWWFAPIYTEKGLSKQKLELKKREILIRKQLNNAFYVPARIAVGASVAVSGTMTYDTSDTC